MGREGGGGGPAAAKTLPGASRIVTLVDRRTLFEQLDVKVSCNNFNQSKTRV